MKSTGKSPELIPNDDPRWKNKVKAVEDIDFVPVEKEMGMPAKTACNECPFSKSSTPGYLGGYTADMYKPLVLGRVLFPCHLTQTWDDVTRVEDQRHCTGLCHMRANMELPYDPESGIGKAMSAAGKDPDFFESFEEFKQHHEGSK